MRIQIPVLVIIEIAILHFHCSARIALRANQAAHAINWVADKIMATHIFVDEAMMYFHAIHEHFCLS